MTEHSSSNKWCPFWDKSKKTCRLADIGLFIPTHDHILSFCENEFYMKCGHYVGKLHTQEKPINGGTSRPLKNRRHYTRIPTSQMLAVSRYSLAREEDEAVLDDRASAVDLSLGGMRIETLAPININQIVSFSFDEHFHPPGFKGKGEVRWIQRDESQGAPVNAGLAFVDQETTETIRNHLLGLGEKLLRLSGF